MPLLTITSSKRVDPERKPSLLEELAELYAETMDSETRFLSITLQQLPREDIWLGRATDADSDVVVLEADVREGRPTEQRRAFALAFMEKIHGEWGVPEPNMKTVFTEHEGAHMMGHDRIGGEWRPEDGS